LKEEVRIQAHKKTIQKSYIISKVYKRKQDTYDSQVKHRYLVQFLTIAPYVFSVTSDQSEAVLKVQDCTIRHIVPPFCC